MKINTAIVSCNDNPLYLDFWPVVSKLWKEHLNLTPILCLVANRMPDGLCTQYGNVILFRPLNNIPLAFQAQWARFFYATKQEKKVAIISDIDMLPLSTYYFKDQISNIERNKYIHINPYTEQSPSPLKLRIKHYAGCYHIAMGDIFKNVLELGNEWEESCRLVYNFNFDPLLKGNLPEKEWYADELYTSMKIHNYNKSSIFKIIPRPRGVNGQRIDRSNWNWDRFLLKNRFYYDAHCPRPYARHKESIENIVDETLYKSARDSPKKTKISVITAVLNGASHIEQTIKSVLDQNFHTLEYIIIDGGSTDGTIDIIKKYETKITHWESVPDNGISHAFNKGIEKATGDIIGIINADDWYEPHTFDIVETFYNNNLEIDIFYGKTSWIKKPENNLFPNNPLAHIGLFQQMSLSHPSIFVTKKGYYTIGPFNLKYRLAMDYDFLLRAILSGHKFKFMNFHIANYRAGGLTYQFFEKSREECIKIREILLPK